MLFFVKFRCFDKRISCFKAVCCGRGHGERDYAAGRMGVVVGKSVCRLSRMKTNLVGRR